MTKGYEKLLASCQTCVLPKLSVGWNFTCSWCWHRLSELLYLPLPELKTASQKADSIQIGTNSGSNLGGETDEDAIRGGKWEDEEERRFFEDIPDLKDYVPKSVLGIEEEEVSEEKEKADKERAEAEVKKLEEELNDLASREGNGAAVHANGNTPSSAEDEDEDG